MHPEKIPATPAALTAEWLTTALRESGALPAGRVARFELAPLGTGQGLIGELARVRLEYEPAALDAPRTLIAKFPSAHAANRAFGVGLHFYECEGRFYQQLAAQVPARTPRCYFSGMNRAAGDFLLLLEDLTAAQVGDQVAGCSPGDAATAVRAAARLHAAWWERPELASLHWVPQLDRFVPAYHERYRHAWATFVAKEDARLPAALREIGERLERHFPWAWHRLTRPPQTLVHGDFRLDNLLFPPIPGGDPIALLDWQALRRGHGMFDVAYFLCESLAVADRRAEERDLVAAYHSMLAEEGVRGYSLAQCWEDYRLSLFVCFIRCSIAVATYDLGNERGEALVGCLTSRLFAAMLDHQVAELLPP